jgi:hypothetical protein
MTAPNLLVLLVALALPPAATARNYNHEHHESGEGWGGFFSIDYDGSVDRTLASAPEIGVSYGLTETISLELSTGAYTDFRQAVDWRNDGILKLAADWAFIEDHERNLYAHAYIEAQGPSILATQGADITVGAKVDWQLQGKWWLGIGTGTVLATAADDGSRVGYGYAHISTTYQSKWLANDSDTLELNLYGATHEQPDYGNTLTLDLEYAFDVSDAWSTSLSIGSELATPYDRSPLFIRASVQWRF